MDYKIEKNSSEGSICLHPELAKTLGITNTAAKQLRFGSKRLPINVNLSNLLEENKTQISSNILKKSTIPLPCRYEIQLRDDEILLGPFIGLLAGDSDETVK